MDSNSIIQLASALDNQQLAQQQQTAVLKLANDQLAAQGELMMSLLSTVPAATTSSGNIINTKV